VIKDEEQILAKEIYNYRLDDSGIMKSPIGKIGKKLEARVHLIKIKKTRVKKIIETLNKAEINVENLIYSGEAGSKAVLQTSDKVNGVALVDIGHGLTEITIFKNNRLISANIIPIGGMHYINDLKYILELNQEVIKSLLLELKVKDAGEKLTITYLEDGKSITKTYEVNYLRDIIDARTDEIVNYILKNIEASGYKEYIKNGIVLIGGVVNDYGILEKLKSQVNHNVKIGTTLNISGMNTELKKTSSASGMGVLLTALEEAYNDIKNETEEKQEKEKLKHKVEKKKTDEKLEVKEKKEKTKTKAKMIKPKLDSSKMDKLKKWLSNFI
jgi:cell division protein FtsA